MFDKLKDAYDKYVLMESRINLLENKIRELEKKVKENTHIGRMCPKCGKPTLQFDYVDKIVCMGGNYETGEMNYGPIKQYQAHCTECNWTCDDQEFIKHCLQSL